MRKLAAAVLLTAALALALLWHRLPEVWAIHWGVHGRPDGWVHKSVLAAYGPLLFGAVLVTLVEALSRLGTKGPLVEATRDLIGCVDLGVAILSAGLSLWMPLAQPRSGSTIVLFALLSLGATITLGLVRYARAVRHLKAQGVAGLEGYHGIFYRNAKDTRLWVPKLSGPGWTLNFAHPWAWPVLLLLLAPAIAVIAFTIWNVASR